MILMSRDRWVWLSEISLRHDNALKSKRKITINFSRAVSTKERTKQVPNSFHNSKIVPKCQMPWIFKSMGNTCAYSLRAHENVPLQNVDSPCASSDLEKEASRIWTPEPEIRIQIWVHLLTSFGATVLRKPSDYLIAWFWEVFPLSNISC